MIKSLDQINASLFSSKILDGHSGQNRAAPIAPQTIEAIVDSISQQLNGKGHIIFQIMAKTLDSQKAKLYLQSDIPAPKGAKITLINRGDTLHMQPPSKELQQLALLQISQRQHTTPAQALTQGLKHLHTLQQALQNTPNLPTAEKKLLRQINNLLQVQGNTKPDTRNIEQRVQQSGLWLEQKIADQQAPARWQSDVKLQLVKIISLLSSHINHPQTLQTLLKNALPTAALLPSPNQQTKTRQLPTFPYVSLYRTIPTETVLSPMAGKAMTYAGHPPPQTLTKTETLALPQFTQAPSRQTTEQGIVQSASVTTLRHTALVPAQQAAVSSNVVTPLKAAIKSVPMALTQTPTTTVNINSVPSDQPSTRLDNGLFQLLQKNTPTMPSITNNQPIVSQLNPSSSPDKPSLTRLVVSKDAIVVTKTDNTLRLKSLPMTPSNDHGNTVIAIPISKPIPSLLYLLKIFSPPIAEPHPDDEPLQQAPLGISFVALWPQLNQLRNDGKKMDSNVERLIKSLFVGLQRIQGQQIDSLISQRDGLTTSSHSHYWQMDLPLLLGDKFHSGQLHIYQKNDEEAERKNGPSKQTGWGMRLNFELGEHGDMTVHAGLLGHQLQLSIWLSRPCTLQKAEQGISKLLEKFRHAVLHIEEITCHAGTPPAIKPSLQLLETQT